MRYLGACLASALLSGCGVVEAVQTSKAFELVGLAPDEPCVVTAREGRRLAGAYLRQPVASGGGDVFFVTGKPSKAGVPKNLKFNDLTVRRVRPTEDGQLEGWRSSEAVPIPGLGSDGNLPAAYTLSYEADGISFAGPAVIGPSPAGFEIPTTGRVIYEGTAQLTLTASAEAEKTVAQAKFIMDIGYGSQQAQLSIDASGAGLPFDGVTWSRLGICGTRIVSSGQGQVFFVQPDGAREAPFQNGRETTPIRAVLESSQFARAERPGTPDSFGGTFIIAGDTGTLTGVFLATQAKTEVNTDPL
ncbi:hypothetical protein So717_24440 [Roseobacter cerasinus]|uniref:Lipoprotein n=1 Tax=Roseobacter cerasinus TaxID=2602289 RepID=A0A640VUB5_9RHOB|nr:hypothetical protein [Roseobacter cerasinus]GFE50691.1 hypothetical protein So717_24440 [Roseobacter cerasinus]